MSFELLYRLVLIFLWTLAGIILIASFILTYFIGKKRVRDNPNKAYIFVKRGNHIGTPFKGEIAGKPSRNGTRYKYNNTTVLVPSTYGEIYHKTRRMIIVNYIGQIIASPFTDDKPLSKLERENLIYEFTESHIGSDAIKALKGNKAFGMFIIIVVAFIIGLIAIVGYNYMKSTMGTAPVNTPAQQEQSTTKPQEIDLKPVEVVK